LEEENVIPPGVFDHMHMDIKDMMTMSVQGNLYTTWVVDKGSGKHCVYYSERKTEKEDVVESSVKEEVIPSGHPMVKTLTADCDPNFLDTRFRDLCGLMGVKMEFSHSNLHQSNDRAERATQADVKLMRTVMARYYTPKAYWQYALDYVERRRERRERHGVFKPHVRIGCMVGYSKIVPGSYLVMDHDGVVRTRPQVYCKDYHGLVGLESLKSEADPIYDNGKILKYEMGEYLDRTKRDPEQIWRTAKLPADHHTHLDQAEEEKGY
jgi:hypothetical protein